MHRSLRLIATGLGLLAAGAASAAKMQPPSAVLGESTTSIAAVRYVEAGPAGRLVFRRIEKIEGGDEIPELIDLSAPPQLAGLISPQDIYLIAYSRDGAQLIVAAGLEPALWRDSPKARELVRWKAGSDEATQRERVPELMALFDAADPQFQNFASAEIVLRPSMAKHLDAMQRERLRAFARGQGGNVTARARLLEAASRKMAGFGDPEWREIAQHVLAGTSPRVQQADGYANLVRCAFAILDNDRDVIAPGVLERWIASDDTSLAEAALLALRREAPAHELTALDAALSLSLLPAGTREFLLEHRRRLVASQQQAGR